VRILFFFVSVPAEVLKHFNDNASKVMLGEGEQGSVDVKLIPPEKVAAEIARLP